MSFLYTKAETGSEESSDPPRVTWVGTEWVTGLSVLLHWVSPGEWWGEDTPRDYLGLGPPGPQRVSALLTGPPPPPAKPPAYPGQADSGGDFVGHILPVDMAHPGAGDVLHAAPTHPHLQGEREREDDIPASHSSKASAWIAHERPVDRSRDGGNWRDGSSTHSWPHRVPPRGRTLPRASCAQPHCSLTGTPGTQGEQRPILQMRTTEAQRS